MHSRFLLLVVLTLVLSGCLTSVDPIFDKDQVEYDPRLEGRFTSESSDGHTLKSEWYFERNFPNTYVVSMKDGPANIRMIGTLFRLSSGLYLDLYPIEDGGQWHKPSEPQTESQMLHGALYEPRHLIWKVEVSDTSLTYSAPTRKGIGQAIVEVPELKPSLRNYGELAMVLLPASKKEAQDWLSKLASDPKVFDWKARLVKKP